MCNQHFMIFQNQANFKEVVCFNPNTPRLHHRKVEYLYALTMQIRSELICRCLLPIYLYTVIM